MDSQNIKSSLLPSLLLLSVALIWGCGFIVTDSAVKSGIPPALLMTLRFIIPSALMAVWFFRDLRRATKADILYSAGAGFVLFLAFCSQTYGIKFTTPANSAFLTATNVIMVPFLSLILFRQRPGIKSVFCAFSCFIGAAILSWSPDIGISFNLGDKLTLLCAFLFACHYAYLGCFAPKISSTGVLCTVQLFSTAVFSFIYYLFAERGTASFSLGGAVLPILYLGLFSTGFCYLVQSWAQRRLSPSQTAIILSAEGFFGSLFSVIMGLDEPTLTFVAGGGIILLSAVAVQIDIPMPRFLKPKKSGSQSV